MSSLLRLFFLFVLLVPPGAQAQSWLAQVAGQQEPEFLEAKDVFRVQVAADGVGGFVLRGKVAPGYYLYRDKLSLLGPKGAVELTLPKGEQKTDEFFGLTEVYYDAVDIAGASASDGAATAVLHWQGCADAGICYPPQTMPIELPPSLPVAKAGRAAQTVPAAISAPPSPAAAKLAPTVPAEAQPLPPAQPVGAIAPATPADTAQAAPAAMGTSAPSPAVAPVAAAAEPAAIGEDEQFASRLANASLAASVAVFFGMGLLLAFTPCTLPMIPIVSSLIVGGQPTPRRALALSAAYVLAMALTYAMLGVGAGLAGANLQAALQNPWLLGTFAAVFVVLALAMFGAFELQLPAWLNNRLQRAGDRQRGGTLAGAAVLGLLSALLVGPCMTAPLAGALLYIGQSGSALTGGLALFALGLGMGLPLLLIAMFGARILPRPGAWMDRVKAVFGYLLLALAISMSARVLPAPTVLMLWGAWLLAIAVGFAAMVAPAGSRPLRQWLPRYFAAIFAIGALMLMWGGAAGASDPLRPLANPGGGARIAQAAPGISYVQVKSADEVARRVAEAGARGQWTLVDFYADWCVSCHVIEREVFGDAQVAQVLAGMQVLRPDVTANDETDQALMRAWKVAGPPTLLLIGPDGVERRSERTVGEIDPGRFLQRLRRVQAEAQ